METEKVKANGKEKAGKAVPKVEVKPPIKQGPTITVKPAKHNRNFILGQVIIAKKKGTREQFAQWADQLYVKGGGSSNEKEQATQVNKALSLLEGMGLLKEENGVFTLVK